MAGKAAQQRVFGDEAKMAVGVGQQLLPTGVSGHGPPARVRAQGAGRAGLKCAGHMISVRSTVLGTMRS